MTAISVSERLLEMAAFYTWLDFTLTVKAANSPFPCLARFFFDSSSTKYYPFFFTDTGRTSGRPAGSFAFVCISLTCSDRHDRGT